MIRYLLIAFALAANFSTAPALAGFGVHKANPECTSKTVHSKIIRRFHQAENIYWKRGYRIADIHGTHFHSNQTHPDSPIARTYCHGTVDFADGRSKKIHYLIESGAGFAGFSWNVEYCIHGLDPWYYYGGDCRVIHK